MNRSATLNILLFLVALALQVSPVDAQFFNLANFLRFLFQFFFPLLGGNEPETNSPTGSPTLPPTLLSVPTSMPTATPTSAPTTSPPTTGPTVGPTSQPTLAPTRAPTASPTTSPPTLGPTLGPTSQPTLGPTRAPTASPTTGAPTSMPTNAPSSSPTKEPTMSPTSSPTRAPSAEPTNMPTLSPTSTPTNFPTRMPTISPTLAPTTTPTNMPTASPTKNPTLSPTTPNSDPITSPQEVRVNEGDTDFSLNLVAPTDPDLDPLTITITGLPSQGSVTKAGGAAVSVHGTLSVTEFSALIYDAPTFATLADFTPDGGSLTYRVTDGRGGSSEDVVTFRLLRFPNSAPLAPTAILTVETSSIGTQLFGTAPTDAEGGPLTITVLAVPSSGTVRKANTSVSVGDTLEASDITGLTFDAPVSPASGLIFGFTVVDDSDASTSGFAQITVELPTITTTGSPNSPPVISVVDANLAFDVGTRNNPLGLSASDPDGDTLAILLPQVPTDGTFTLPNGDSVMSGDTITSSDLAGLVYDAPSSFTTGGPFTLIVVANDGVVSSSIATVFISVNNPVANTAPIADSKTITVALGSKNVPLDITAPSDAEQDDASLEVFAVLFPGQGVIKKANGVTLSGGPLAISDLTSLVYDAPDSTTVSTAVTFQYAVSDGVLSSFGIVTINFTV